MSLSLVVGDTTVWLPAAAALGMAVGFIAGMFGIGGGFLLIPLLHVVLGLPLPYAVGAGLCQIIATAVGAFLRYRGLGLAESRFDLMMLGGSLLGVHVGARGLVALQELGSVRVFGREIAILRLTVSLVYIALMATIATLLWRDSSNGREADRRPGPLARIRVPPYVRLPAAGIERVSGPVVGVTGLATGALAGLLGTGGGMILISIMIYGYGFDVKRAAGTGLVVVMAVAMLGTVEHARLGHVHLGLVVTLMIGAALAAQLGATLTHRLSPSMLRRGLAIVLIVTMAGLVFNLLR